MAEPRNKNVGVAFPFRFSSSGRVQLSGGKADQVPTVKELDAALKEAVHHLVATEKGERVMLGQLGVGAARFLFHPLGNLASGFLRQEVWEQFSWFLSRAQLRRVEVTADARAAEILVQVELAHRGFGDESILKFRIGSE